MKNLSYRDVVILLMQVAPKSTFNNWPAVALETPLDIPSLNAFNVGFTIEWYYFNVNGYVKSDSDSGSKRFYMLRVLKRARRKYPAGTENLPWIMSDVICVNVEGEPPVHEHVCAPCYSSGATNIQSDDPYYLLSSQPISIIYKPNGCSSTGSCSHRVTNINPSTGIIVDESGKMTTNYKSDVVSFDVSCKCNKDILLQGPWLNGLDPPSTDFVSSVSGASYLYYSWPTWTLSGSITLGTKKYTVQRTFELWLDHQGGVVKSPSNKLISELAIFAGARPLIFPGWNWFSI